MNRFLVLNSFANGSVHHTSAEVFHFPRTARQMQKVVQAIALREYSTSRVLVVSAESISRTLYMTNFLAIFLSYENSTMSPCRYYLFRGNVLYSWVHLPWCCPTIPIRHEKLLWKMSVSSISRTPKRGSICIIFPSIYLVVSVESISRIPIRMEI